MGIPQDTFKTTQLQGASRNPRMPGNRFALAHKAAYRRLGTQRVRWKNEQNDRRVGATQRDIVRPYG